MMDDLSDTLHETNSSHLKMDDWKMNFLLGWPIFRDDLLVLGSVFTCPKDPDPSKAWRHFDDPTILAI